MINEDELMKDETSAIEKFCGEDDKVKAGKPCENCTCGRKEYFLLLKISYRLEEGTITEKQLETGGVQSSCGKCYLGDAFRCGSCPYLGQPAFEAGDKVTLKNANQNGVAIEAEKVTIKTSGRKVMLDL